MPTSDGEVYGFKYVNGHPANTKEGLQTVTAFGMLADVETGYPVLLTEMTILTALRTAATSAVAAKHLAAKGAKVMAMIGNGAQSEFQALAFKTILGIEEVRLYDIDPAATEKCARNLAGRGLNVVSCTSSQEALEGAQIVTTCTADKQYATILTDNMVGAGLHINAIGGDCPGKTELHKDILLRSGIFCGIYAANPHRRRNPAARRRLSSHRTLGSDHGQKKEGRKSDGQITLFDGVGFAVEDFSALRFLRDHYKQTGFYEDLDMIADPDDPRDLFGMVQRAKTPEQAAS